MFLLWWRLTFHLWCLDFVRDLFLKLLFLWSIELFWIDYVSKFMYLNSCSMDLGRDRRGWWLAWFGDQCDLMIGVVWWSAAMEAWFDQMKKGKVRWGWPKPKDKEREEVIKIINASATITVHICTVTVAIGHKCIILHKLMCCFLGQNV